MTNEGAPPMRIGCVALDFTSLGGALAQVRNTVQKNRSTVFGFCNRQTVAHLVLV